MPIPALFKRILFVSFLVFPCFSLASVPVLAAGEAAGTTGTVPLTASGVPAPGALDAKAGQELLERFKASGSVTVLDVRTPEEFQAGHIPGAMNIPLDKLEARMSEIPADKPLFVVCRTGRRAASAYELLHKARPADKEIWFLQATPEYRPDGSYLFR